MCKVQIKYVSELAKKPFYATDGAAGMDLSAAIAEPVTIKKGELLRVPTGIAIALPNAETVAYLYARSGLATKHGICLSNSVGVIDSDYRGEISVGLINLGPEDYTIAPGERIAQMVFAPVIRAELCEVESLEETQRGAGGFGSTGR
ncbi:MAG: dUTP diphosphatase [Clostridia bacterium]|nr:dUTP diphosphatase [Clostridia bacterium]MBQ3553925.1 dUTP diphosphatase [Clostridia bacterium]